MVKFKVKPTLKENWRYIGFEVISESKFEDKQVVKAITNSILKFLGELGASETNVWLIDYNAQSSKGIVRCSNKALTNVLAAITTIIKIDDKQAILNAIGVSGTIKKLKLKKF